MKYINLLATTAMSVALTAGAASAQNLGSSTFSAGVSLLSPEVTGFVFGGQADVSGFGSAAVMVAADDAEFSMSGFAASMDAEGDALSNSGSLTTFTFDRMVAASASGIGLGRVVSSGEASASVGSVGRSVADTMVSGSASDNSGGSDSSSSTALSDSSASLIGTGTTSVIAGLVGENEDFIGDTGTVVTSEQSGVSYAGLSVSGSQGMNIGEEDGVNPLSTQLAGLQQGEGIIGFTNLFSMDNPIDLNVDNLGNGAITLGASTGGFFGGGASTLGESTFGSINSNP